MVVESADDDASRAVDDPSAEDAPESVAFVPTADVQMLENEGGLTEEESTETVASPTEPEFSPLWILRDNVEPVRRGEEHSSVYLADMTNF